MPITFQNIDSAFVLKQKTKRKQWLSKVILNEKKKLGTVNYVFTTDSVLLGYNQHYLHHNTFTDIITFDSTTGAIISGDIIISIDRVKENAEKFDVDFEQELNQVLVHGILHLLGYKDKRKKDSEEMRKQEAKALKLFQNML